MRLEMPFPELAESSRAVLAHLPAMTFLERDREIFPANAAAYEAVEGRTSVAAGALFAGDYPMPAPDAHSFRCRLALPCGLILSVNVAVRPFPPAGPGVRILLVTEAGDASAEERPVAAASGYLQEMFDAAPESMVILEHTRVIRVNREFVRMFGYAVERCVGAELDELVVPDGHRHESEILLHGVASDGRATMESVRRTSTGHLLDVSIAMARLELGGGVPGYSLTFRDIGRQKQAEARLRHTALHDGLTGLANRVLFLDRLNLTMARLQRRPDRNFAVVFLDVDRFKQVNDLYGHAAGDALLLAVTARLKACVRPQDTVARFGGDEFALLLDEMGRAEDIAQIADRIQAELQRPVEADEHEVYVSASMGIALGSLEYDNADDIMRDADAAMYRAKANGKARHEFFTRLVEAAA